MKFLTQRNFTKFVSWEKMLMRDIQSAVDQQCIVYVYDFHSHLCGASYIQLFREMLSEKVHATISKGIGGGFEFSVFQRNLKELERQAMEMCLRVLKESNKRRFDSYSRQEQCIDYIPYFLSGLSRAHFFRQPFSK